MTVIESTQVELEESILLIGDLLIDRTFYVDVPKISPEAPVPVAMLTGPPIDTPGGAGLGAAFAAKSNWNTLFFTYCSQDTAKWIQDSYNIEVFSPGDNSVVSVTKTRYIDNERFYHLIRVDSDNIADKPFVSPSEEEAQWLYFIEEAIKNKNIKVITLLDYRKGLFNKERSEKIISLGQKYNIPVYVDSRANDLDKFKGATVLKLNSKELSNAYLNFNVSSKEELRCLLDVHVVLETKGASGAEITTTKETLSCKPNISNSHGAPDVTGCGDAFDMTFCHEWCIKEVDMFSALKNAVDKASDFAYEPIGDRLKCQN